MKKPKESIYFCKKCGNSYPVLDGDLGLRLKNIVAVYCTLCSKNGNLFRIEEKKDALV